MIIKIPQNNIHERIYIIDILIGEFLGLSYSIEVSGNTDYHLLFDGKEIVIEDHFFNHYPTNHSYLNEAAIPKVVSFVRNQFIVEQDIPVIFGNDQLIVEDDFIFCGNDIFAASYFMLTRWEEHVNPARDLYNRFSAKDSLAYKFNFLDRPIVNEFVEMLWRMLQRLGYIGERRKRKYEFVLTHDVDHLRYYNGFISIFRRIAGDIIIRKKYNTILTVIKEWFEIKKGYKNDPYDTFDWIMDLSDEIDIKSRFYFMSSDKTDKDNRYNINSSVANKILKNIKGRKHLIGFHPSINSYNNPEIWAKEKASLEAAGNIKVTEGRQHYLRFELPLTWTIWNDNGLNKDLSLGYADKEGFRCGVCYEFSVFDFLRREKLLLKELPLTVMEVSFFRYQNITPEEMYDKTIKIINTVKNFDGSFVYLWHNSSFNTPNWSAYKSIYESIIRSNKN